MVERGAELFGLRKEELLAKTDVIRYSTTVGTNAIIQRSGPKLGVLVTKGHEADLYGARRQRPRRFVSATWSWAWTRRSALTGSSVLSMWWRRCRRSRA